LIVPLRTVDACSMSPSIYYTKDGRLRVIDSELAGGEMTTRDVFRPLSGSFGLWGYKLVVVKMKCPIYTLHRFLVTYLCTQMRITMGNPLLIGPTQ
jgi:hypothetical protein